MHVLVIQNFDGTGLGQLKFALDHVGASVETVHAHRGDPFPATCEDHDALVVLGGGQNALADDLHPYLPALCDLMRTLTEADRSVLGVCLGSQLLARAFGAENIIGGASEFAWQQVDLSDDGIADPLFSGVPATFRIFQWHDDTFILPRRATRLAGSLAVHNQAFRIGRASYGVQFHFEADRSMVERWNVEFADWLAERRPDWFDRHSSEAALHGAEADAVGDIIARNWAATIEHG